MRHAEWVAIATIVTIGGIIVWAIVVAFRWLTSQSWKAMLSPFDGGIHLTSKKGGITLTRDSEHKLIDIENPLQGFIHNEVEKDEETEYYTIEEVVGDIIINYGNNDDSTDEVPIPIRAQSAPVLAKIVYFCREKLFRWTFDC